MIAGLCRENHGTQPSYARLLTPLHNTKKGEGEMSQ